jgi:hypothetical protein
MTNSFVSTVEAGICLISIIGIPWAVTQWAPFSLVCTTKSNLGRQHGNDIIVSGSDTDIDPNN